ncbi:hypothetical protein BJV74DRAFT_39641 [Russula compacta]|nr:hypothetical protein BJV74DRAFT_39641 [Russula compacta]
MVNFQDPFVILQDTLAVTKLWHTVAGLYFWEFATTLDYEWSIIRGRRPYRWTIWIYSLTRVAALVAVILCLFGIDVTSPYNCEAETVLQLVSGYTALAAASFLIVLRIIAIWNKNKVVIAIATSVWVTNLAFLIHNVVGIRAFWVPLEATCYVPNIHSTKLNILVSLATDIILLLIMLFGLLRMGVHQRGAFDLGRLLWKQGLIWLLIATIAEILPAVFLCLNLNDPFNYMFQIPSMVTMSIAATRIYRCLAEFASGHLEIPSGPESLQTSGFTCPKGNRTFPTPIPPNPEVTIHVAYEQHPPPTSEHGSLISIGRQLHNKPVGLGLDDDLESRAETRTSH